MSKKHKIVVSVITILAALIGGGVVIYLTINTGNHNATSKDQSGGVTAGTINYNTATASATGAGGTALAIGNVENLEIHGKTPDRQLSKEYTDLLNTTLEKHKGKSVMVWYTSNEDETIKFAYKIKDYLISTGWKIESTGPSFSTIPPNPVADTLPGVYLWGDEANHVIIEVHANG